MLEGAGRDGADWLMFASCLRRTTSPKRVGVTIAATGTARACDLPTPRGSLTEALFGALRSGDDFFAVLAALPNASRRRRARAVGPPPAALPRLRPTSPTSSSGTRSCSGVRAVAGARPRGTGCASRFAAPAGLSLRRGLLRLGGRARRRLARRARAPRRRPRPGPGAAAGPLDLPPQGVRPDRLGGAAARRARPRRR